MDERLEKALEFSNYRATIETQKKNLQMRVETQQTVHYNGGSFCADQTLIAFTKAQLDLDAESFVVVDLRNKPFTIDDPQDFLEKLVSAYNAAMNEYVNEEKRLTRMRNVKTIMDW